MTTTGINWITLQTLGITVLTLQKRKGKGKESGEGGGKTRGRTGAAGAATRTAWAKAWLPHMLEENMREAAHKMEMVRRVNEVSVIVFISDTHDSP